MSLFNARPTADVRKVLSGKDGGLFNAAGELMGTTEDFTAQVSITNASYRPLGFFLELSRPESAKVTLAFTEIIIKDDDLIKAVIEMLKTGYFEPMVFQGVMRSPYNGTEQRVVYRDCVPDSNIDLQNMKVGEIYKRQWNWAVNQPPDLQSFLTE